MSIQRSQAIMNVIGCKGNSWKYILLLPFLFILSFYSINAQHTSKNNNTGDWMMPTSWSPTWAAPSTSLNGVDITINGYITVNGSLTMGGSASTLMINDTLVVLGDLTLGSNNDIVVNNSGVLIVRGNFSADNKTLIAANAYIVVTGDFTKNGSQGSFTSNDSPSNVYIGGTIDVPAGWASDGVLNCTSGPEHTSSGCNYGNTTDAINNPIISSFLQSTCSALTITSQPASISRCAGLTASFNVAATGALTYQWQVNTGSGYSNLANGGVYLGVTSTTLSISNVNGLSGYSYRCIVANGSCIKTTNDAMLTVFSYPGFTSQPSTASQSLCMNASVTALSVVATAGSGTIGGYQWYSNPTASNSGGTPVSGATSANYTPLTSTTGTLYYYCVVTNSNGCSTVSNVSGAITVNARPTSAISGPTSVCNGSTATISVALTGTPNWNLTYYDGTSSTTINGITTSPYTFNITPNASQTYTVTALSDNKCAAQASNMTGSAAIVLNNRPTSNVSGSASICKGTSTNISIALTGTGPWNLTYYDGTTSTNITSINTSPYTLSVSPASNRTYTVTALSDAKCNAQAADMTGSATITLNNRPTSVISGSATVCSGTSTNISIAFTGSGPWDVTYSDGSTSTTVNTINTNPYTFSVSPASSRTYTVTALSDIKCAAIAADMTGSAVITVNNPASASVLSGTQTICSGKSGNINVAITGGTSPYKVILSDVSTVNNYSSGSAIAKSPTATTTYTLTSVQDANGCYSDGLSGSAVLTVISIPAVPSVITPASPLACQSNSNTYSVTNDPVVSTYTWTYSGTGATLTPSGNSISIAYGASATSGTLSVTAGNSCGTSLAQTLPVTVNSNVTPSVSITASPTGTICYGTNVTYTATPTNGGAPSYQWYLNSSPVGTNANTWSANYILSSDAVRCEMTSSLCSNAGTNPAISNTITKTVNKDVINLTSVSATALCAGSPINVSFTTPCAFVNTPVNSFIAQLSNASGSFTSPTDIGTLTAFNAGSYTINATIPTSTPTGTGYLIRVVSSNASFGTGISGSSSAISVTSSTGTPISATTYGNGTWNVFCYNGNAGYGIYSGATSPGTVNSYLGYYTETGLSFDTRNRWAINVSPATTVASSYGSAYIGCTSLQSTNIYLSFKRTNIPCGNYTIDIPYHDDAYELYIDGTRVDTHNGCCDVHTAAWTGWIGPSNLVEFRLFQGTGSAGLQVTFTQNSLLSVSPSPTICSGASTTLTATGGGSTVSYAWSPATFLNTTSGNTVISTPTSSTTYTVSATDIASGCASTANVTVNVSNTINLTVTKVPNITAICQGTTSTVLTASGANTYTWSPATGLSATSGPTVTASPGSNTTYTVTGNNGCTSASTTVSLTGQIPGDSLNFAPGAWYAFCYDTTLFKKYYGYYTEAGAAPNGLSFNTTTKWNATNGPTVSNPTYVGCSMNGTYYSIKLKRTGVSCGYYSVSVNLQDDILSFWVNGVQVWNNNAYTTTLQPDIWTGFIGPTTQLEFRLINNAGPGQVQVTFTKLTGINNLSPSATVCAGTSTTISTGTMTGASYSWSSTTGNNAWLSTTSGTSTVVTPPAATSNGIYYFVRTLTDGTTGCSVNDSVPITVNPLANTTVTPTDTTIYCTSSPVRLTAAGASTYTWSPSTGLSATTGYTVNATPAVTTTYTVAGSNNCNVKNATANITVVPLPTVSTYPTGRWNVYAFNGTTNWTNYYGYHTITGVGTTGYDFDTRDIWKLNASQAGQQTAYGPSYALASAGSAYVGCPIGVDNFSTSFKRTGFACGFYQIDITYHDDNAYLYIDGTLVWSHVGCCDTHSDVWSGFLSPTSQVEFRQSEGGGGAGLGVHFSTKTPTFSSITVSPITGICSGGSTSATLTAAAIGIGNTYTWSPVTGLSATTGASTTALPATTTKYYVRVSNCGGSVYGDTAITVKVLQPPVINTHPSPQTICAGNNTSFSISSSNALGYQWEYSTNGGVSWADVTDGGIYSGATTQALVITGVTASYSGTRYRCRTTNWACSTVFSNDALLTINQVPANPGSITGTATVCQNTTGVTFSVANVSLATSYTWTLPIGATIATGAGTNSITVNFGTVSGNVTVAGTNTCGNSVTPATFPVTVNTSVPADPGTIIGSNSVCINSTGITYTVPAVSGASTYSWIVPTGASITAGATTNTITVSYGAAAVSGNVTVTAINPCGASVNPASLAITVSTTKPGNPVVITGTTDVCSGSSSSYSLGLVTGATSYTWTVPSGSSITSGNGTNNITVQFGSTSGNITAAGTNGCGSSTLPATLGVNVYTPLATAPGAITGSNSVCQSVSGITYSVPSLTGATGYTWSLPSGASITSGTNTNSITASYGAAATNGNVSVYGSNVCGNSPTSTLAVAVNSGVPNNPGSIAGLTEVCKGSTGKIYSISPVTGATSYNWTLPGGATITAGAGTNSITVSYGAAAASGNISVVGVNGCGVSTTPAIMAISVISTGPAQPLAFTTSSTSVCPGQTNVLYVVPNDASATSYTWSYSGTGASTSSTSNNASFDFSTSATNGNISVRANNDCGASTPRTIAITINTNVSITGQPAAPAAICAGSGTSTFTVTAGGTSPYTYQWQENQGSGWNDITNGGVYANVTGATLSIINPPLGMNNWQYRCAVSGACGAAVSSNAASLKINPLPTTGPIYHLPNN